MLCLPMVFFMNGLTIFLTICPYLVVFILPSNSTMGLIPFQEKQPQIMTSLLSICTVGLVHLMARQHARPNTWPDNMHIFLLRIKKMCCFPMRASLSESTVAEESMCGAWCGRHTPSSAPDKNCDTETPGKKFYTIDIMGNKARLTK